MNTEENKFTDNNLSDFEKILNDPWVVGITSFVPCRVCKRILTNKDSIAAGIGPECASKASQGEEEEGEM